MFLSFWSLEPSCGVWWRSRVWSFRYTLALRFSWFFLIAGVFSRHWTCFFGRLSSFSLSLSMEVVDSLAELLDSSKHESLLIIPYEGSCWFMVYVALFGLVYSCYGYLWFIYFIELLILCDCFTLSYLRFWFTTLGLLLSITCFFLVSLC